MSALYVAWSAARNGWMVLRNTGSKLSADIVSGPWPSAEEANKQLALAPVERPMVALTNAAESAFSRIKHHNYVLPEPKFWGRRTGHSRLHIRVSKPEVGGFELYTKEQVIEMLNAAYGR